MSLTSDHCSSRVSLRRFQAADRKLNIYGNQLVRQKPEKSAQFPSILSFPDLPAAFTLLTLLEICWCSIDSSKDIQLTRTVTLSGTCVLSQIQQEVGCSAGGEAWLRSLSNTAGTQALELTCR